MWEIDAHAVNEAVTLLGITWPVTVRATKNKRGGTGGWRESNGAIQLFATVDRSKSAAEASRTIWHELTHCLQYERLCRTLGLTTLAERVEALELDHKQESRLGHSRGYYQKPCEIEAKEAETYHEALPLVRDLSADMDNILANL